MKNVLLVPIQTDALFLSEDTLVTEASVDFSRLPFFNGKRDVNADVANISENVVSLPLADQNLRLRRGLHLHWALPDAMNRGRHREDGRTDFPLVPNRWLVSRRMDGETKSWVVESDYLFPEEKNLAEDDPRRLARRESVTVPAEIGERESGRQPYRHLGRKMESSDYPKKLKADEGRYGALTTVGYGEPSFAAFYPNCRSVFGFHDPEIFEKNKKATYQVIGWYAEAENDFFQKLTDRTVEVLLADFVRQFPEMSVEEAENLWIDLLRLGLLDDRPATESPAERALVVPISKWENDLPDGPNMRAAAKYLEGLLAQRLRERAGWAVEAVVSKAEWNALLAGNPSEELWLLFAQSGWLKPLPGDVNWAAIAPPEERNHEAIAGAILPDALAQFEMLFDQLRRQKSAGQLLLHSTIEVDTGDEDGELPRDKVENLSITIGNTGTEALSTYLSKLVTKPDRPAEMAKAEFFAQVPAINPGFRDMAWNELIRVEWLLEKDGEPDTVALNPKRKPNDFPVSLKDFQSNFIQLFEVTEKRHAERLENNIEDQFEALYLLDKLDHRILDIEAKFREARHENGFNALAGGHLWTVSLESENTTAADAARLADQPKLPPEAAHLLNEVNSLQAKYDRAKGELESLGTQLFADWYKYMMTTYPPEDTRVDFPDIDEVRYFIESKVMAPLKEKEEETGQLVLAKPEEIKAGKAPASGKGGKPAATAKTLARRINDLFKKLNEENAALPPGNPRFVLKRIGGPRYYRPKEPVVLLTNDKKDNPILQPTRRHGQDGRQRADGLLACRSLPFAEFGDDYLAKPDELEKVLPALEKLRDPALEHQLGFAKWTGQPWNPFRLDWEVELLPLNKGTNIEEMDYDPDFLRKKFAFEREGITAHYFDLPVNSPDLVPANSSDLTAKIEGRNPNIYVGKSLLTPQAKRNFFGKLETHLIEVMPKVDHIGELESFFTDETLPQLILKELTINHPHIAPYFEAYILLRNQNLHLLSQALSGFNDALLQLRQTFQLPITDPIGFLDYQPFTKEVARLAADSTQLAPQPLTDFNPIRNGKLVINQLRLMDTFGQVREIDLGQFDRVLGGRHELTAKEGSTIHVPLQPRLPQPARLHFRWLSAEEGQVEMNTHPNTSPICGWILTNQLDDSLVIYDAGGTMLGSIEAEMDGGLARWNPAPGARQPVLPQAIPNVFLRKMVAQIRRGGEEYVARFLDGLDTVLSTIEPEEADHQQALSLLIGRPVALVRASLNLELQGAPAVDQGWKAFYDDREDGDLDRKRDGFTQVKIPVRLGKDEQFNDGLVGFWKENEAGELGEDFHFNFFSTENHAGLAYLDDGQPPIEQTLESDAQLVSMLIDPRGKVHVTTGILPVKDISIPPGQYLPAMRRLGVTFLTAPLLSPAANIQSLLPTGEGFQWSWLERQGENWREVFPFPTIGRGEFVAAFAGGVLEILLSKNWIVPFGPDAFEFLPEEEHLPIEAFTERVDEDVFGILDEISREMTFEDGSLHFHFDQKDFRAKLARQNDLGGKVWNLLVRSDVTWCQFIPDRPDRFVILPQAERSSHELPEVGLETLVESILAAHAQHLSEPRTDAHFGAAGMSIREGYLKLKVG